MARPLDAVLAMTADTDRLRRDVESIATRNHIHALDCWQYLRQRGPGWMKIVAADEIRRINKSTDDLCRRLNALVA